jgi:hypothetical protein
VEEEKDHNEKVKEEKELHPLHVEDLPVDEVVQLEALEKEQKEPLIERKEVEAEEEEVLHLVEAEKKEVEEEEEEVLKVEEEECVMLKCLSNVLLLQKKQVGILCRRNQNPEERFYYQE